MWRRGPYVFWHIYYHPLEGCKVSGIERVGFHITGWTCKPRITMNYSKTRLTLAWIIDIHGNSMGQKLTCLRRWFTNGVFYASTISLIVSIKQRLIISLMRIIRQWPVAQLQVVLCRMRCEELRAAVTWFDKTNRHSSTYIHLISNEQLRRAFSTANEGRGFPVVEYRWYLEPRRRDIYNIGIHIHHRTSRYIVCRGCLRAWDAPPRRDVWQSTGEEPWRNLRKNVAPRCNNTVPARIPRIMTLQSIYFFKTTFFPPALRYIIWPIDFSLSSVLFPTRILIRFFDLVRLWILYE